MKETTVIETAQEIIKTTEETIVRYKETIKHAEKVIKETAAFIDMMKSQKKSDVQLDDKVFIDMLNNIKI